MLEFTIKKAIAWGRNGFAMAAMEGPTGICNIAYHCSHIAPDIAGRKRLKTSPIDVCKKSIAYKREIYIILIGVTRKWIIVTPHPTNKTPHHVLRTAPGKCANGFFFAGRISAKKPLDPGPHCAKLYLALAGYPRIFPAYPAALSLSPPGLPSGAAGYFFRRHP